MNFTELCVLSVSVNPKRFNWFLISWRVQPVQSKQFAKIRQFDLVIIKWNDAHNLPSEWVTLDALPELNADYLIETVGRYLKSTPTQAVFCADMSVNKDDAVMLNTIYAIPHACIESIKVIRSEE